MSTVLILIISWMIISDNVCEKLVTDAGTTMTTIMIVRRMKLNGTMFMDLI